MSHLGERIAALEAQMAEFTAREDKAAEDRHRKWEALNSLRDEVKAIGAQQALIVSRMEAIGQMAQVAKDFVAAAREIPTRDDFGRLIAENHQTAIQLAELRTQFVMVKTDRDASIDRMWKVTIGALGTGLSSLLGLVVTWLSTRH